MKTKFYLFILSIFALVSCEGSRTARMIDTVEGAVDDYNNGDSTTLIILIIGAIVLGGLWLYSKKDK
jgi:LPXTG-motif cell wall-anchored protein